VRTADEPTHAAAATERVLDRYRLVRRLGAGGFGVVWLAEDERLQRTVAVKRIAMHDAGVAARAEREARAAARLAHPGIVALYESGRDADAVYLVSELVRGRTLADLMEEGELSDRDVLRIGVALCDALAHAHGRGVIHRDVKPGNVIVPDGPPGDGLGVAKLTDFGIARMLGDDALTATGDVVGTLAYMAPEQADGREVGEEADLYALALVLYEALSGVNPVRGRGAAATARRVGARLPALGRLRRDLPLELCRALDRAVLPRPEQRGTLQELRAALAEGLPIAHDERGTIAGSPLEGLARVGGAGTPRGPVRPKARAVAAVAAAGLAAAGVAWLGSGVGAAVSPAAGAGAAGLAVLLLPRLGWLAMAAALALWAGGAEAIVLAAAAVPTVLLLRRAGTLWSLPAGAPVLGMVGLAGAWPVLAAQADRPWHRAALGALGCWWLLLAETLTGDRLALGAPPGASAAHVWPLVTSGALALAALWAGAAVLLPVLVRGRTFPVDLVAATAWAAGLGSATQAIAGTLASQPSMRGLVAGAVVAGGLAVAIAASRGEAYARCAS
jgi:eukaryotic-like serine/threonine-protein kinase